eukprot:c34587_g1_i1 orf=1-378(-)
MAATHEVPSLKEVTVEGTREALQDGLEGEGIEGSKAGSVEDSLPALLKIISMGEYSFIGCDSPNADTQSDSHSTNINMSDLDPYIKCLDSKEHGIELSRDTDSLLYGVSPCNQPESSKVDTYKLAA